jgi:hypothetical protein
MIAVVAVAGFSFYRSHVFSPVRFERLMTWLRDPAGHTDWTMNAGEICNGAPFQMPTDGYIGFLWGDSFRIGHHHQGIDVFGGDEVGVTSVYAAYAGYLTRQADWKSTVIIRVPDDPLQPGRQIWVYYTHMATRRQSLSPVSQRARTRSTSRRARCWVTRGTIQARQTTRWECTCTFRL